MDRVKPAAHVNPPAGDRYNLVVIGAGTAGLVTAAGAAGVGARVALIERHMFGGDCLNTGCVPSKAVIHAARLIHDQKRAQAYGVETPTKIDFGAVMNQMRQSRAHISEADSVQRFQGLGVHVFLGQASFTSPNTVRVGDAELSFARACIATGARPAVPPIPGLEAAGYLTSTSVWNLTSLPPRLVIIGAGPIGIELAQTFSRFGSKVTVLGRRSRILVKEDADAVAVVQQSLMADGVAFQLEVAEYVRVDVNADEKSVVLRLKDEKEEAIPCDAILVAAGRQPNIEGLELETAGIEYSATGVTVNDFLQTTNGNVYAAGDVCSQYQFTHVADAMARIVIRNSLFFGRSRMSGLIIPWATYTDPEIAHTGAYARDLPGIQIRSFRRDLDTIDRAIIEGNQGFVNVIVKDGTDIILGATAVGRNAGDIISEVTTAMVGGIGLSRMATIIHPYPTTAHVLARLGDDFNRTKLTATVQYGFEKLLEFRR